MKKTKQEMYHKAHFSSSTYFNYSCPVTRLADGLVESSSFVHNRGLNSGSSSRSSSSSSSRSSSCNQNSNCSHSNCSRSIEREGGIGLRRGTSKSKSRSRSRSAAWFPISVYDLVIIDDLCESNKETEDAEETESRAKSQEVHEYEYAEGSLFVRRNRPQAFISIESACKYDPGLCGSAMYIDTLELEKEGKGEGVCGLLPVWVREESVSVSVVGSINIDDDDDDGTCEKRERDGGDKVCSSTVYVTWYRSDGINEQGNNRSADITSSLLFFSFSILTIYCALFILYHVNMIYMYAII